MDTQTKRGEHMKNALVTTHWHRWNSGITAVAALVMLVVVVVPVLAGSRDVGNLGNPSVSPPQSNFRGLSYGEWSARFFQWAYSLPVTHHPLFDTADCSTGQTG